jgi:hypothetical protein
MTKDIVCPERGETILKAGELPASPEERYSIQQGVFVVIIVNNR